MRLLRASFSGGPNNLLALAQAMDPAQLRPEAALHAIVSAFRVARPQLLADATLAAAGSRGRANTASPRARAPRAPAAKGPAAPVVEHAVIEVSDGGSSDSDFVTDVPARRRPSLNGGRAAAPSRADPAPSSTHAACPVCSWCACLSAPRVLVRATLTPRVLCSQVPLKLVDAHVNSCLDKGPAHAGRGSGASAPAGAPVQLPPVLTLHMLTLSMLKTHLRKWKLLDQTSNEKRDALEARWTAFMTNVKVEKDRALTTGLPVNVAAAAAKTLREERTRSSAALISPIMRKHAAAAAAAPSAAANGFAALVGQVRARKEHAAAQSGPPEAAAEDLETSPATDGRPKRKRSQG